jgi:hypothetical protein
MINALICAYKSGDVLRLTLEQLADARCVTRILVADGPHLGPVKPGYKVDRPSVRDVVKKLGCKKIVYEHTDDCPTRADKNNRILKQVSKDCDWILCVDSDEVYHEDALMRLARFLESAEFGRYCIHTINPYPDFHHQFKIPDWKPRLYRWFEGARCPPKHDRHHQFVLHPQQKECRDQERMGMVRMPERVCECWHLNALRAAPLNQQRVTMQKDGTIVWTGGKRRCKSGIYPLDIRTAPRSIRELKRRTL